MIACADWLDAADGLLRGGGRYAQAAAAMLDNYRTESGWRCAASTPLRHLDPRPIITFDNPFTGSTAPYLRRILMAAKVLQTDPTDRAFVSRVAVLAHELWHTRQPRLDRYSVWGELEAHQVELRVRIELQPDRYADLTERQAALLALGDPLNHQPIPRDRKSLCAARYLLSDYWVYRLEPLYFIGGVIPVPQQGICSI